MRNLSLRSGLHQVHQSYFGATADLIRDTAVRKGASLMIACSEQGAAPDNVSFAHSGSFVIIQHLAASVPSQVECEAYPGLSFLDVAKLFDEYDFRHVVVCGHLGCGVIPYWLQAGSDEKADIGGFRKRFENGTRNLVDENYSPQSATERCRIMVCEKVLCQIDNLLSHEFVMQRAIAKQTWVHGWVVNDKTARVYGYSPKTSSFEPI